jgi:hypothetical protein
LAGLVLGAALVLAGCSGGGGAHTTPLPGTTTQAGSGSGTSSGKSATANFTLAIPKEITIARRHRAPQYVSSATLSGVLVVNGGAADYINLAAGSPACTTTSQSVNVCTFSAPAVIGSNRVSLTLYSGAYTGTGPSGSPLSTAANFAFTVTEGTTNVTVPLVLNAIPASVTFSESLAPPNYVTNAVGTLAVTLKDASNETIVGPGSLVDASGNPISITLSLNSNSGYALSPDGSTADDGSTLAISDPTQQVYIIATSATPLIGTEIGVTTNSSAITSIPSYTYVQQTYAPVDYDAISITSLATATTLQGGASPGSIAGVGAISGTPIIFSGNGSTFSGCTTSPAATDVGVNTSGILIGIDGGTSTTFETQNPAAGTFYTCATNGTYPSFFDGFYSTMTFAPTDASVSSPAFTGVYAYGGPCTLYDEAYETQSSGPTCSAAWSLTYDTSWLAGTSAISAYGYTIGEDGVAFINANGTAGATSPYLTAGGELGGVAVRDGVTWALDTGNTVGPVNPRMFEISANGDDNTVFELDYPGGYGCFLAAGSAPRTMVVGEDGLLYVASGGSSCSGSYATGLQVYGIGNGVSTGTLVTTIAPGVQVISVATDTAGRIYFDDSDGHLYRYPSAADETTHALHRKPRENETTRR